MKHLDELAAALAREGVTHAFGVTGGGPSLHLICALAEVGIPFHPVAHEAAAALMAGGACADGQTRAVAIGIKGPGFANFYPGIVSNHYENRPALVITEYYPDNTPPQRMHKRLDHAAAGREVLKADATLDANATCITDLMNQLRAEAPGPGLLQIGGAPDESVIPATPIPARTHGHLDNILGLAARAERPALILGSAASRHVSTEILAGMQLPVVTTAAAKGAFDENSPFSGGVITGEVKDVSPEHAILRHADLLIAIGLRNTEVVKADPMGVPLVSLDNTNNIYDGYRRGYEPDHEVIVSDLEDAVKQLAAVLAEKSWGADLVEARRGELARMWGEAWAPPAAFLYLQQQQPEATLVLDTGYFCTVGETAWRASEPNRFCGSSNGRFMGTAIPTAIGLATAHPERPVICVCGDGGIRPYLPELRLARALELPIQFVLMSDGLYGSIAHGGRAKGLQSDAYTIEGHRWANVVAAMDLPVASAASLDELTRIAPPSGPSFLEMQFEPEAYFHSAKDLR